MKIIPKLLRGGGFELFFTLYTPIQELTATRGALSSPSKSKSDDDDTKGKLTEKDLFSMIKEIEGLPNEMSALVTNLMNTFLISKLTGEGIEDLASTYLSSLYRLKIAKDNKVKYDDAVKKAMTDGAMAEPAIALDGSLVAQDTRTGHLTMVGLDALAKNPKAYKILSTSQLANLRAYDPKLINDYNTIDIINNSIGYEGFTKLMKEGILALGTSTKEFDYVKGLDGKEASSQLAALQNAPRSKRVEILKNIYKGTVTKENSLNLLESALGYIISTMPLRMKTWASYKLGITNGDTAAKLLVTSYLASGMSSTEKDTFDLSKILKGGSSKEGDDSEEGELGFSKGFTPSDALKFLAGLGSLETIQINPGKRDGIMVNARSSAITTREGNPVGANSTLLDITLTLFGNILDLRYTSVGGRVIPSLMYNLVLSNDGKIYSIDHPYTLDELGRPVPEITLDIVNRKEKANNTLRSMGIDITKEEDVKANYVKINEVYKSNGLNPKYDANGRPTNWMRFGVINAIVTGNVVGEDYDSTLLSEVPENVANALEKQLLKSDKKYSNPTHGGFLGFGTSDSVYYGTVWIPIRRDSYQTAGTGQRLSDVLTLEENQAEHNKYELQLQMLEAIGFKHGPKV